MRKMFGNGENKGSKVNTHLTLIQGPRNVFWSGVLKKKSERSERSEQNVNRRGVQGQSPWRGSRGRSPWKLRGFRHLKTVWWAYFEQWRSQDLSGWATRPPGRLKWWRKWRKFEEKWEKIQEDEERLRKYFHLAHPGVRGWLLPWFWDLFVTIPGHIKLIKNWRKS